MNQTVPKDIKSNVSLCIHEPSKYVYKILKNKNNEINDIFLMIYSKFIVDIDTKIQNSNSNKKITSLKKKKIIMQNNYKELMTNGLNHNFNKNEFLNKTAYLQYLIHAYQVFISQNCICICIYHN